MSMEVFSPAEVLYIINFIGIQSLIILGVKMYNG